MSTETSEDRKPDTRGVVACIRDLVGENAAFLRVTASGVSGRLTARAYAADGTPLPLRPEYRTAFARWTVRAHPGANWSVSHDLTLATAELAPSPAPAGPAHGDGR